MSAEEEKWHWHSVVMAWANTTGRSFCLTSRECWLPNGHLGGHVNARGKEYFLLDEVD